MLPEFPNLKSLLENDRIEDIVLSPKGLAFYSQGIWQGPSPSADSEKTALLALARHIAESASQSLGLTQPSVDAFLVSCQRTFRAHVVISPLVLEGPEITLRRIPSLQRFSLDDFEQQVSQRKKLEQHLRHRHSMLIAGATGSGKTSLLTALLRQIPAQERVLILEDSPEIPVPNALSNKLLSRCDRFGFREGATWDLSHLVFESLRMRPDRLVLGECRGPEAQAIQRALMTGHGGVLTTLHAGSCAQALQRFQELVAAADSTPSAPPVIPLWDVVVHMETRPNGERHITEILELSTSV